MREFAGTARFVVERRLGAGGMGVVYEVHDRERSMRVALKTLRALDARGLYRFKSEFRSLADVAHPNLVRLGELFGDGDEWFFTMELIEGVDFLTWVRQYPGPDEDTGAMTTRMTMPDDPTPVEASPPTVIVAPQLDERRLRGALRQLAQGIAALHDAGKVHRDVKPSNVMVTAAGRVVLLDFGLATDADRADRLDSGVTVVGTAAYMAPEQARQLAVGPEVDWYAVGVMLYEALTGQQPFAGSPLEILLKKQSYEPPPPRSLVSSIAPDLDELCVELLRREPRDRPGTAQILERLGASRPTRSASGAMVALTPEGPPFVGRADELAALRAALAEAERGLPISMFVLGESGIGKSALVRNFLDHLERRDALVLAGRCYERESVPFKAFDDVVDALAGHLSKADPAQVEAMLPPDVSTLARVFPVLRRVAVLARQPEVYVAELQELRTRAFAALRALLFELARTRPVIVFIDDFQWTDADSLALFSAVMHGLEAPPLLFVATVRASVDDVTTGRLPRALASVENVPGDLRTLSVRGLPPDEARGLAARLLHAAGEATPADLGRVVEEAAGHPMFLHELVRHLSAATRGNREARLDDALWSRIGLLEADARRFLEVIAIAGEPVAQRIAMQAAGLDMSELGRVAGVLRVASLVRTGGARGGDSIECYHDRVREAVVARLDGATLRIHHEGLANALEAAGAGQDAQSLVRHLEAAGLHERAGEHAARAARIAAHALAFDRAAAMYATALRLGRHTDAQARALRIAMGDALVDAGRGTDAANAFLEAASGADAATRLECQRKAAGHLLITGDIERGLETLDGVLAEVGERMPATPRAALASLLWNRAIVRLRGTRFTPRDESAISPRELVLIDIHNAVGAGLGLVDTIRGGDFQARGLRMALRSGERRRITRALALDSGMLASQGPRANARAMRRMARVSEIVGDDRDPWLRGWAIGGHGFAHYLGGRFALGAELLDEAEPLLRQDTQGNIWELNTVRIYRLFALRYLGRWRELRAGLSERLLDAARRGDRYAETTLTRGCNVAWLVTDEPARARRELETRGWSPPQGGYHIQHWYELRARFELALYEGDLDGARALVRGVSEDLRRSMLVRVQTIRAETTWMTGRVALAHGDAAAAAAAAKRLSKEGVEYARAWGLLLEAGVAARAGDAALRKRRLLDARDVARAADLAMVAAAAQVLLEDVRGEEAMRAEGVKQPDRMVALIAPGS